MLGSCMARRALRWPLLTKLTAFFSRVVLAPDTHRYSVAYFTVPAWDAVVKPLKPLVKAEDVSADEDEADMLGPDGVQVIDYINAKYKKHFADAGTAADADS